jgi:hypothetical protein
MSYIPLISLIIAVLAVFIGPIIQIIIAKAQIHASIISANRQRWIDNFRDMTAEFVTAVPELIVLQGSDTIGKLVSDIDAEQKFMTIQLIRSKIELMLNSRDEKHKSLLSLMEDATNSILHPEKYKMDSSAIIATAQDIITNELNLIKANK